MSAHILIQEGGRRSSSEKRNGRRALQLGWPHFWLLFFILGTLLGLVGLVFFVGLWPR